MLLQRLRDYAEQRLGMELPPAMYQEQPIRYVIDLDEQGRFLGMTDTADPSSKATRRGTPRLAPYVKRGFAIKPKLLMDTAEYVFKIPRPETRPERLEELHRAFVALVEACAAATNEPSVGAVARFLATVDVGRLVLPAAVDPTANITFRVDGVWAIDLPSVRAFWAALRGPEEGGDDATLLPCIVCGQIRPVLGRHPLPIKGIPGGQITKDLISANAKAFESYGLENSLIAPTCQVCAEAYANALNALLSDPNSKYIAGGLAFAFWTPVEVGFQLGRLFAEPDPGEVRELLRAARTGHGGALELDQTAFYAVTLGASGKRAVVRDWIDTTVGEAKRRLGRYFSLQELVDEYGEEGRPLGIGRLVGATVRDPRKDDPPPLVPSSLLRLALVGSPLPMDLLYLTVRRLRADGEVTRARVALIQLVLGSQPGKEEGAVERMVELDLASTEPAYLCGRLLAVLDRVQQLALGSPNATIIDKFYGTASSAPASVFGTLLHGAQAHLGKLRKEPRTQAAHAALERRIEEILAPLHEFPKTLSLEDQGLFALGFYHQRAFDRRAARERREARELAAPEEEAAGDDAA